MKYRWHRRVRSAPTGPFVTDRSRTNCLAQKGTSKSLVREARPSRDQLQKHKNRRESSSGGLNTFLEQTSKHARRFDIEQQ